MFQSFIWPPVFKVFSELLPPSYRERACANAAATNPIATVLTYFAYRRRVARMQTELAAGHAQG